MAANIGACGLVCSGCQAYLATQADDRVAMEGVAATWREQFNAPGITVEWIACDGCMTSGARKCGHCAECGIRGCAVGRGVANCAGCVDYPCPQVAGFLAQVPEARRTLDELRAAL
jgi:hypothetical protein